MLDYKWELLFWSGIMRDHAVFQVNALAPNEQMYLQYSMYYRDFFEQMIVELENTRDYKPLVSNLLQGLQCFIEYKRMLLKALTMCDIKMNLPPSLINHQINEAMEFLALLTTPQQCLCNMMNLAGYIKMWLVDGIGHAAAISGFLDPSEELLQQQAVKFKMIFGKLQIKASELEMIINKTGLQDGSLKLLADESIGWMCKFIHYLDKVRTLRGNCQVLGFGTFSPQIPDHFIREHEYFITKINDCMRRESRKNT